MATLTTHREPSDRSSHSSPDSPAMPKENHYAVVVGVDQYPSYLNGKKNLNCPQNDAKAVRNWLLRADGGGLPPPVAGAAESPNLTLITREVPPGRPPPCPLI